MLGSGPERSGLSVRLGPAQVLHGCRQLVSWDVGLSPATSATLFFSCQRFGRALWKYRRWQAGGRRGWRQVLMALTGWATHVLQWRWQWAAMGRPGANPQKPSQFGLFSATREHEVGIASNRGSARRGEYVPGPCTHRPSHHGSWFYLKPVR